ncbi:MAG: cytochrome b/b6 domain-containing protein [Candidatus Thiothrix putei]|uniref:Cytochrome b/b6 domain-containing protein n=1 Tax=Candidatus Thiothrix putei TaxID=3080811 RepID=A0AA95HBT8_9GAMM|nr:MAG: cytochrome b/b6 domain-containing protein [Candidatus Thiothrix putei]
MEQSTDNTATLLTIGVDPASQQRNWQCTTRWLHGFIAVGISGQLLLSLVMANPHRLQQASGFGRFALEVHEMLGLATLLFMVAHWVWVMLPRSDISFAHLFPYTPAGLRRVLADMRHLWHERKLPPISEIGGLSGFIHGLGFLTASVMVSSGFGLYLALELGGGVKSSAFHTLGNIHGFFGNLMWAYLTGHVLAAAWHQYRGEPIITNMFRRNPVQ